VQPTAANGNVLEGFVYPIAGGCLPKGDQLMPNAPRTYRQGVHEGIDLYGVDNCTSIGLGTPVHAVKAGRVIRVDTDYQNPTPAQMTALLANPTPETSIDAFRGRQVWVDHGGGVVTRYCHLSAVAQGLSVGQSVNQGDVIAFVGESGTPESVSNPGNEYHLHFEVRVGSSYLGAGEAPQRVRELYTALFKP
jgi:murein DD-endopeptidase MepM/ murein hydrolase activator NlpD